MLLPVAPINSWYQVILALSASTCPNWNRCSSSASQSDSSCCLWSYFPIKFTIEFILKMSVLNSESKSRNLYFSLYVFITFYFLSFKNFYLSFSFLTLCPFLVITRTSNPPPLPPLLVRLFSLYAVVPISVPFLGCVRLSGHVPRLLFFSFFSKWILILLVRGKHRKTL